MRFNSKIGYQAGTGGQLMELPRGLYVSDKRILLELLRTCQILEAGVWVDGIYTILDEGGLRADWIDGHEVYFKIEGRIDRSRGEG